MLCHGELRRRGGARPFVACGSFPRAEVRCTLHFRARIGLPRGRCRSFRAAGETPLAFERDAFPDEIDFSLARLDPPESTRTNARVRDTRRGADASHGFDPFSHRRKKP